MGYYIFCRMMTCNVNNKWFRKHEFIINNIYNWDDTKESCWVVLFTTLASSILKEISKSKDKKVRFYTIHPQSSNMFLGLKIYWDSHSRPENLK